jgi:Uma2 family endonuclease
MENYNEEDQILREPLAAYGKNTFTIEEYLQYENASQEKHEYYNGEIFAMAGASDDHCRISRNLLISLGNSLENTPCEPMGTDFRLHIPSNTLFTYPDVSVMCKGSFPESETGAALPNVLIEVLSTSTRKYDRGKKFQLYKDIPTLQEYILVDSQKAAIDIYRKTVQNTWELQQYTTNDSSIEIKALHLKISFERIYYGTQLKVNNEFPSIGAYKGNIDRA